MNASFADWRWPSSNIALCIGLDEAGRGALAGEIFVAASWVRVDTAYPSNLNDSKLLSPAQRERLFSEVCNALEAYAIASASIEEVETLNPLHATLLAMQRLVTTCAKRFNHATQIFVDGNIKPALPLPTEAIVRGDQRVPAIACASILAKVARDHKMRQWALRYPGYGFEVHKGYATALHLERLAELGPCAIHRQTFAPVKKVLANFASPLRAHAEIRASGLWDDFQLAEHSVSNA